MIRTPGDVLTNQQKLVSPLMGPAQIWKAEQAANVFLRSISTEWLCYDSFNFRFFNVLLYVSFIDKNDSLAGGPRFTGRLCAQLGSPKKAHPSSLPFCGFQGHQGPMPRPRAWQFQPLDRLPFPI